LRLLFVSRALAALRYCVAILPMLQSRSSGLP
jgi:hypothetical protein